MKRIHRPLQAEHLEQRRMLAFGLVADTNQFSKNAGPSEFVEAAGTYFFTATDTQDDRELWTFDPNTEMSSRVKDIRPGNDCSCPETILALNDHVYFVATVDHEEFGTIQQLWVSDGTEDGTQGLLDVALVGSVAMGVVGDAVYFENDLVGSKGLWRTQGTVESTVQLTDQLTDGSASIPFVVNDKLISWTTHSERGLEWWTTDGTADGTQAAIVEAPRPERGENNQIVIGDRFFFTAYTEETGVELWVSDGTQDGTHIVRDLFEGAGSSTPENFHLSADGSTLLFVATDAESGAELWRSDGTEDGTRLVKDIFAGTDGSDPARFWNHKGMTYFAANSIDNGTEMWRTDGTPEQTQMVIDINPGTASGGMTPLGILGESFAFLAVAPDDGTQVWMTDGTDTGTSQVTSLPGRRGRGLNRIRRFGQFNDSIFLVVTTEPEEKYGDELMITDGSAEGTIVIDINPGPEASVARDFQTINGKLYFTATDGRSGIERFVSDGTPEGTRLVVDFNSATEGANPNLLGQLDSGTYLYLANDGIHGKELWSAAPDGSAQLLQDLTVGDAPTILNDFAFLRGRMLFSQRDGIWATDGTPVGTHRILDLSPGATSNSNEFWLIGDRVFFTARVENQLQLWKTDGTVDGTKVVKTLGDVQGLQLVETGGQVFFTADDENRGEELWITDGTPTGTRLVKDILDGPESSDITNMLALQGRIYFTADDVQGRPRLWTSDGTVDGTYQFVEDLEVVGLAKTDDFLFFSGRDPDRAFWRSDGTQAGTIKLLDSDPQLNRWATLDGMAYFFVFNESMQREEFWKTDGTVEGTTSEQQLIEFLGDPAEATGMWQWNNRILFRNSSGFHISDGTVEGTQAIAPEEFTVVGTSNQVNITGRGAYLSLTTLETGREVFLATPEVQANPQVEDFVVNDGEASLQTIDTIAVTFSEDISTSLTPDDLVITSSASEGQPLDIREAVLHWNGATKTATWDLSTLDLGFDTYTVILSRNAIFDEHGNNLDGNGDGINGDVFRRVFSTAIPGDVNLDGEVNFADFLTLSGNFGRSHVSWDHGDLNGDLKVDFADFLLLSANFGRTVNGAGAAALSEHNVDAAMESFRATSRETRVAENPVLPVPQIHAVRPIFHCWTCNSR